MISIRHQSAPKSSSPSARVKAALKTEQLRRLQNTSVRINGVVYIINELLGHGGQGAAFGATRSDGMQVVVKRVTWEGNTSPGMPQQPPGAKGFSKEVRFLGQLSPVSRRVVDFYDADVHNQSNGPVFGYTVTARGTGDLNKMIDAMARRKRQCSAASEGNSFTCAQDRKFVWRQLIACVEVMHRHCVVNTDLKPGNFIHFDGEIKLNDFGAAINYNKPGKHYTGFGTSGWSAPEVKHPDKYSPQGTRASPKADIWSIGAILYYMTYGKAPVPTGHYEVGYSHASAPPRGKQKPRDPHLRNILRITLQMNPMKRPSIIQLQQHPYTLSNI